MKTKLIIVALLAFAAGGTCPSDVNNDGTVGIVDFLQVLGDWGPCPSATVVDISADAWASVTPLVVRAWSDGYLEYKQTIQVPWAPVPEDTGASGATVVGVAVANTFFSGSGWTRYNVYVQWDNGETRWAIYHSVDGWSAWETYE